ncbi:hypothetical protein [Nonomuraea sp. NPDC046570]|uniref:hypothetical protein n=1 Tax=Nonomuraea sp. NPDC046570 TaxID=3155255 RepID=UPI0033E07003
MPRARVVLDDLRSVLHLDPPLRGGQARAWLYGIVTNLIGRHRRSEIRLYRALSRSVTRDDSGNHADRVADQVTVSS